MRSLFSRMFLSVAFLFLSSLAHAVGFIDLPAVEKAKLEDPIRRAYQLTQLSVEVSRLGGFGCSSAL